MNSLRPFQLTERLLQDLALCDDDPKRIVQVLGLTSQDIALAQESGEFEEDEQPGLQDLLAAAEAVERRQQLKATVVRDAHEASVAAASLAQPIIGNHTTFFEPPDTIFLKLRGAFSSEEGSELNRQHREWGKTLGRVFFLVDLAELDRIDPEVRRAAATTMAGLPLRGMVAYSAPIKARVIAKLIFTAMNLFSNKADRVPLHFTETEEEARAWIEERRRELDAGTAKAAEGAAHGN